MNLLEQMEQEAFDEGVNIDYVQFKSTNLKGLYVDGNIAVKEGMTSIEKSCVLSEELGHHYTSSGNILSLSDTKNRKQERVARIWAYNRCIGLYGIIEAYKHRCFEKAEISEYLNVTEEFLLEAIKCYSEKYGVCVEFDNYIIFFQPSLAVIENI